MEILHSEFQNSISSDFLLKMNLKFYIFILLVSFAFSACSSSRAASENRIEVIFDDGYKTDGEVVFDDRYLNTDNPQTSTTTESPQETTEIGDDNSEITTRYDSHGNKTETRYFGNHSRVSFVVIQTSADGQKQVYVYGYGKEVKTLQGDISDRALTAPGDEIANAAGLYQTRSEKEIKNFMKKSQPLQALPSSDFPIQAPQNTTQPEALQNTGSQTESSSSSESEETAGRNPELENL